MRGNFVSILIGGIVENFSTTTVESLLNRLFEIKNVAKIPSGSNYSIERAKLTGGNSIIDNTLSKTIYIKEKDESLRYLLRTALELQGFDVQEELDLEKVQQPSIIISDSGENLGDLPLLAEIKKNKNFVNTKIIATSTVHDKVAILDAGADVYLPKPYEILDLIRWVEFLLNK